MKARLKYITPGLLLIALHAILWAVGAPASHVSTLILAVGITGMLWVIYDLHQKLLKVREAHIQLLEREQTFYTYARRVFNAQTAVIARLQARTYRRN